MANGAEAQAAGGGSGTVLGRLHELYEGDSPRAQAFRYGLLVFDIATIFYIVATSFSERFAFLRTRLRNDDNAKSEEKRDQQHKCF